MSRAMDPERVRRSLRACVAYRDREAREGRPRNPGQTEQLCEALLASWRHTATLEAQRDDARDALGVARRLAGRARAMLDDVGWHEKDEAIYALWRTLREEIPAAWVRAGRPEGG